MVMQANSNSGRYHPCFGADTRDSAVSSASPDHRAPLLPTAPRPDRPNGQTGRSARVGLGLALTQVATGRADDLEARKDGSPTGSSRSLPNLFRPKEDIGQGRVTADLDSGVDANNLV